MKFSHALFFTLLSVSAGARPARRAGDTCAAPSNTTVTPAPSQTAGGSKSRFVVYANEWLTDTTWPSAEDLVGWNVFNIAFMFGDANTTQNLQPIDEASAWAALEDATRAKILQGYKDNGISLMLSLFGSQSNPVSKGNKSAGDYAQSAAAFVTKYGLDGVDVDFEDFDAFDNGNGAAEAFLVNLTRALREELPRPQYLISHAPVAPWFSQDHYPGRGYMLVHQEAGGDIDFYNVQFYNQNDYLDCDALMYHSTSTDFPRTSVSELIKAGIPAEKLVVGKPGNSSDASDGYIAPKSLGSCFDEAATKNVTFGGIMSWEWPNANAQWIKQAKGATFL